MNGSRFLPGYALPKQSLWAKADVKQKEVHFSPSVHQLIFYHNYGLQLCFTVEPAVV